MLSEQGCNKWKTNKREQDLKQNFFLRLKYEAKEEYPVGGVSQCEPEGGGRWCETMNHSEGA